mmetsp:Transcript_24946/g.63528  ORF Transcript_24946/g.63528 Transcript_24946/m.63528 type:complete len:224 (+) Transcript_24946:374-1045(+)
MPRPRKTLTELEPVTLPMAASAESSPSAALLEAKVSGSEVPRATSVIATTDGLSPSVQPSKLARSPMTAVRPPMRTMAHTKHSLPPQKEVGGTKATSSFQGSEMAWIVLPPMPAPSSSASACLNWSAQLVEPSRASSRLRPIIATALSARVRTFSSSSMVTRASERSAEPSVCSSKVAPPVGFDSSTSKNCVPCRMSSSMIGMQMDFGATSLSSHVSVPWTAV